MTNKTKETSTLTLWEKETKIIFCDLCLKEIKQGNRSTIFFSKECWQNITKKFKEITGRECDRMQLKNKWDQLKKDWKIWKDLKRGSMDLGWDPVKRTIDASEEWWIERLAVVPAAKKYKLCGLDPELEEKLDQLFGVVVATDKYACAPSETGSCGSPENMIFNLSGDSTDLHSPELPKIQSTYRSKRPLVDDRKKGGAAYLRNKKSQLLDTSNDDPHIFQANSIKQVLQFLDEDKEISEDFELYFFALELFQDSVHRDFFSAIAKERRVGYLRYFYARRET